MEVNMLKRYFIIIVISLGLLTLLPTDVIAQSDVELKLSLSRAFGFSSGTGRIQGTFDIKVTGPENLDRVVFYIDEDIIGEDNQAPFTLRFQTDEHSLGIHTIFAKGYTSQGNEIISNVQKREFVSSEEGWKSAGKIAIPIIALSLGFAVFSFIIPQILNRRKKGTIPLGKHRNYGIMGGAICPKCERPFSRHIWGLNLGFGKLDRCPNCGKWSVVRRAPISILRKAEEAELEKESETKKQPEISESEKFQRDLERSRYEDF